MRSLEQLAASYREEAGERVAELEVTLLELERAPDDAELVSRAFRALHTIKGSGAMFGFDEVAAFTHELESVFEHVRGGRLPVTRELIGLALAGKDLVRAMLDGEAGPDARERDRLVAAYRKLAPDAPAGAPAERDRGDAGGTPAGHAGAAPRTWRIAFEPNLDLFENGTNPLGLLDELATLGRCVVVARTDAVPPLEELAPERCHLAWAVTLTTDRGEDAIRDVFAFVEDRCTLRVEAVTDAEAVLAAPAPGPAAGAGEVPRSAGGAARPPEAAASSVRVAAAKLDHLVDLVGELVTAQSRLARIAAQAEDADLAAVSEGLERLTADLRDTALDLRMVPIGSAFGRLRRVARDLAADLGKEIDLVTEGAETELDKTVIERLSDPLVHVIRNACDHGIEAPEARRAAGKPPRGTISLSARQAGGSVVVEVRDDGAGIDPAAVRARAEARGLLQPGARVGEADLLNLVFQPGFSTARTVTSVSGRGVGMDVVKRSVEALRGTVALESAPGAGTALRIELPLTLAIIEGLLVEVGGGSYVLPLAAVEECVGLTAAEVEAARGAHLAPVRGELVPYLRLREVFEVRGARPEHEQIAIVRTEAGRCGLAVDQVAGQLQAVVKSMGQMFRGVKGLSGATILGDGSVAPILDVGALLKEHAARAA
ncbi:chemotaxis protein CheA [Anaeromyxobacter dehalogenans]|uniref:Chemotaxis protein CheA n=1 Tax=Anaeromyxobacter dehalogenans (strain 2CP-C) TaxID=290397 RepID=Q2IQS2_ANADE|nr:chemotaxis protein CheA [Anaeromyxobacter dehalogenans]ABC81153.1 CheA signal transduction histidine kinase [Anaeromyxobacter dehalogenans 2CP-C]